MKKLISIVLISLLVITSVILAEEQKTKIEGYNLRVTSDKKGEDFKDLKIVYKLLSIDYYYELMYSDSFIQTIKEDNNFITSDTININNNGEVFLDKKIIDDKLNDAAILVFYLINEKENYILDESIIKILAEKDIPIENESYETINKDKICTTGNTLSVKYKEISHIVSFVNGDICLTQEVLNNEKANPLEVKNIRGYEFQGWYLDDELFDFNTNITKDLTLTAKFQEVNTTIKEPKIEIPDTGIWY